MDKFTINGLEVEVKLAFVKNFLAKIEYPITIFDFETFRNLLDKNKAINYPNDFEKIFSLAILIINNKEDLKSTSLKINTLQLFVKTLIPPVTILTSTAALLEYQQLFFKFLITKLVRFKIKSVVILGAKTETIILKNYLAYHQDKSKFKNKITYFFHNHKIFDLYEIWNHDHIFNLPKYKKASDQDVGATKKTWALIKNNNDYWKLLKPQSSLSNNNIGRVIDQYFSYKISLLPSFTTQVANHNQNDVLIGAVILSLLYNLINPNSQFKK